MSEVQYEAPVDPGADYQPGPEEAVYDESQLDPFDPSFGPHLGAICRKSIAPNRPCRESRLWQQPRRYGPEARAGATDRRRARKGGPRDTGPSVSVAAAQPTLRVKMLAWSAALEIAKNGKKLVPSVPSPS
jgi:hypothetical protein